MSIHNGHRQRLKERFLQEGIDGFEEHNALELLLFYCMPRTDTNPLAHRLIEHFGSFAAVLDASPEELEKVEGVGHNISTFLSFIPQVDRYYQISKVKNRKVLSSVEDCCDFIVPYFRNRKNEVVYILCMDAKCKLLCMKELGEGSVNSAGVPIRRIVDVAMKANATTVILAHNHPGGIAVPSADDVHTTHRVAQALEAVDIVLADHLIVSGEDCVSMAQSGYYRQNEFTLWR